jgi:hypothetical protein
MSKTPKELAEEYSQIIKASQDVDLDDLSWSLISEWEAESFLAGYQAAKDKYEVKLKEVSANWTFCCEDKAKLLQELAAKEDKS